ncbi:MAG: extracellular solute-binding protein [Lachnospiraceae bacterium]|nr:extracellular solute-binding protein [Lachnospiraceae bacterium]
MKRIGSMILTGAMVIGLLSGCGEAGTEAEPNSSETLGSVEEEGENGEAAQLKGIYSGELERDVTIRVLENDTAIAEGYFQELMDAFNEKYKEYGIVVVDANMDQYSNLADDGPYGYGPDVLYQANDVLMKYVEGKHIYPIPVQSMACYDKIPQAAWDAYRADVDGTEYIMGVPVNIQSSMLFYRKDMLPDNWETEWDKDGNKIPDMVENWNDMYRYSKQIVDQGEGKFGYMRSLYDVYFSSGFLFSYGGYVFGDNNTDATDIGFAAGDAAVGANVILQQASLMNEDCIDDSVTVSAYSKLADGTYFATMTTPDVTTLFLRELANAYEKEGLSSEEAQAKAEENLVITQVPKLPASGDLTEENPELIPLKTMGGVNGYAISAYTKAPNACLAFVEFATDYEMVMKRNEYLGIVPARSDAAEAVGGISEIIYSNLDQGDIVLMPSIREIEQVWTPAQTFFQDLAKDAFRTTDKKYTSLDRIKEGLESVDQQIYDAIHTLAGQ